MKRKQTESHAMQDKIKESVNDYDALVFEHDIMYNTINLKWFETFNQIILMCLQHPKLRNLMRLNG